MTLQFPKNFFVSFAYLRFLDQVLEGHGPALPDWICSTRFLNHRSHIGVQHPTSIPLPSQAVSLGHHERSRVCSPFPV